EQPDRPVRALAGNERRHDALRRHGSLLRHLPFGPHECLPRNGLALLPTRWTPAVASTGHAAADTAAGSAPRSPARRAQGHPLVRPNSEISAGTSRDRTKNASIRTPAAMAKASSRNSTRFTMARTAKDIARATPAIVMVRLALGVAEAMASRRGRRRASSQIRPTTKML